MTDQPTSSAIQPLSSVADVRQLFALRRPCAECPFRPDGFVVSRSWAENLIEEQAHGVPFFCHKTTTSAGVTVTDRRARYCAGSLRYGQRMHRHILPARLAIAWGLWNPETLDQDVEVLDTPQALLARHGAGDES